MATMKQANRALKMLPDKAKGEAQQAIDTTAFYVARGAIARAPQLTGLLQRSIAWQRRPRSVSAVVGVDNAEAYYWKFLEYGTVKMSARPMFRPAAEAEREAHLSRLERALERAAAQIEREAER